MLNFVSNTIYLFFSHSFYKQFAGVTEKNKKNVASDF